MPTDANANKTQKGRRMVWGLSLDSWNNLIVLFGVLSGAFVLLTGGATYIAFQLQRHEASESADALARYQFDAGRQIETARAEAEGSRKAAAEANARALESEVKLEQLRKLAEPRDVAIDVFVGKLANKPQSRIEIWYLPDTSDGYWFATRLMGAFIAAKLQVSSPVPIRPDPKDSLPDFVPLAVAAGGQASGITVVSNPDGIKGVPLVETSKWAVMTAISAAVGTGTFGGGSFAVPIGTLRIIVAAKTDPIFKSSDPPPKK